MRLRYQSLSPWLPTHSLDHVPFQFTPRVPLAEHRKSGSTKQFIPAAGTRKCFLWGAPYGFYILTLPALPDASVEFLSLLLLPLSVSIHLTTHQLSSPFPKGWLPPRAQSVFPSAGWATWKRSVPHLPCPALLLCLLSFSGTSVCQ